MKNKISLNKNSSMIRFNDLSKYPFSLIPGILQDNNNMMSEAVSEKVMPEILVLTSYPPIECGIATYSQDLIQALNEKFGNSFSLKICALQSNQKAISYPPEVKYVLNVTEPTQYQNLVQKINADSQIMTVLVQHEFGLYGGDKGDFLINFMANIHKPVITTLHTVLPATDEKIKKIIRAIGSFSKKVVVMTNNAHNILKNEYNVPEEKIDVIHHGTHLVSSFMPQLIKTKRHFSNRLILSTFGLLSSGKSIETALDALPKIVKEFPNVLYLIMGKTHPEIIKKDGEQYRESLYAKVIELKLQNHVKFINQYFPLDKLLEYLQFTDIYLFTSKDPFQAVSGTFAYAMGCGCPVISTPIPHAVEMIDSAGAIVDFQNPDQLAEVCIDLLSNPGLLKKMSLNALHRINATSWQNSAIAYMKLMVKNSDNPDMTLTYKFPEISLNHIKRMTTPKGIIQFASILTPDIQSGYTLDDNARALIAILHHYHITGEIADLTLLETYMNFVTSCQQPDGSFYNYVDHEGIYYNKNKTVNLEDPNGRAIWALGEVIAQESFIDKTLVDRAKSAIDLSLNYLDKIKSPRAMAFAIKGLYHYDFNNSNPELKQLITKFADNLVSKYRGVSDKNWKWFEEYLTYGNSVLPEALLYAYQSTGSELFKEIAKITFEFLLSVQFKNDKIKVISNRGWHHKGKVSQKFGEQPIDVAYTIIALARFYEVFKEPDYLVKMQTAFNWFLGENHLHQIIYNPVTGGCYDGLEENHINLNQGAESTVSYLLSRLTVEQYINTLKMNQDNYTRVFSPETSGSR